MYVQGQRVLSCEPDLLLECPALVELVLIRGDGPLLEVQPALSNPHQLLVVGLHHTSHLVEHVPRQDGATRYRVQPDAWSHDRWVGLCQPQHCLGRRAVLAHGHDSCRPCKVAKLSSLPPLSNLFSSSPCWHYLLAAHAAAPHPDRVGTCCRPDGHGSRSDPRPEWRLHQTPSFHLYGHGLGFKVTAHVCRWAGKPNVAGRRPHAFFNAPAHGEPSGSSTCPPLARM